MIAPEKITPEVVESHGLTKEEYKHVKEILGREPNFTELGIFSVMWSEHCSYKNSRPVLKLFPTDGTSVMVKAGEENAGCLDIGDGLAVVFKIESHNHPSAIEPFQGAATGVGGILRDIFTMGARPVLIMNSLRFGDLERGHVKRLFRGVVGGIAHYGNCIGIPTVGGEVYFDEAYEGNPLVNAMCLGVLEHKDLARGAASGVGNPVYYVGSATGRDGLGGASFASRELTEESHEDRPAVQVGDPFLEKLLLEACLELIATGSVVGIQDMGAAGLTCSTCETASRGRSGVQINISKVPRRETGMIPYEVMLSESQERMLIIVKHGEEHKAEEIFEKWDLHAVNIGEVKDGEKMRIFDGEKLVADIPARLIAEDSPVYQREEKRPAYLEGANKLDLSSISEPSDYGKVLLKLLDHPSIASKEWVYGQYDHMVRTDTVFLPGHDASLVRIKGTKKAIAVSTDCNGLYCYLDPYEGGKIAVAESARNVASSGARPIGMTNCLNFGNPMKPEIFWQFKKCVEGMRDAATKLETPVTGGNVSFYNENPQGAIFPTPTVGMVGILDDIDNRVSSFFREEGGLIFLIGDTLNEIGGSHYLLVEHSLKKGTPPRLDIDKETRLQKLLVKLSGKKILRSAHDLSEGGLACALTECAIGDGTSMKGCKIDIAPILKNGFLRKDCVVFGETQSRVLVSVSKEKKDAFSKLAEEANLPIYEIGKVEGDKVEIKGVLSLKLGDLNDIYRIAIERRIKL